MRSVVITLAALFAAAVSADVSHLSTSYLPAPSSPGTTTTTVEKQELLELPEQIEYAPATMQMQMMPMMMQVQPMMLMNPHEEMTNSVLMTAEHYLPPLPQNVAVKHQQHQQQQHHQQHHYQQQPRQHVQNLATSLSQPYFTLAMNTQQQQKPFLSSPMQAQSYMPHAPVRNTIVMPAPMLERRGSAASYYSRPSMMQQIPQQTYQQYPKQLMRRRQQMLPASQLLNVEGNAMEHQQLHQLQQQQMRSTMPELALADEQSEAEAAHVLSDDGYHYKTGGGNDMPFQFIE